MDDRQQIWNPLNLVDDNAVRPWICIYCFREPFRFGRKKPYSFRVKKINVNRVFEILVYECRLPRPPGAEQEKARFWWGKKTVYNFQIAPQNGIFNSFLAYPGQTVNPAKARKTDDENKDPINRNLALVDGMV